MLFNSIEFAIFLPIIFALYWFVDPKSVRVQNILLLVASYYFYACWDWRFLFLLVFSTLLDYYTGIKMHEASTVKLKKYGSGLVSELIWASLAFLNITTFLLLLLKVPCLK